MSLKKNIIYLYFKGKHLITSKSQYQYNHGQYLYFADLDLPQAFEVHFSNKNMGESKTQIGSNKLVEIPDEYFWSGALEIYAWVYLHSGTDDGETIYEVRIPLIKRAKPTDEEPLPVQQSTIDRAIAELATAVDITTENANKTDSDKIIVSNIKEDVITLKENIDSTASTVNQKAQETINASERAEASAQNAATSERKALDYSQQAEQSAQNALESKNIAQQKSEVAINASNEALGYKNEALDAKNQAEQAKQNIVDYRDETKGYRNETLSAKNDVQTLKGQIEDISDTVNENAQSASQSANSASQSANSASQSASSANQFANSASQSASQAEQFKDQSEANVTHYPKVVNGYWYVWDAVNEEYVNTNVDARGTKGIDGEDGKSGVYIGTEPPTDKDMDVWIDSDGTADDIVSDVQINGQSIVSNGVANVPTASTSRLGVFQTQTMYGLNVTGGGMLYVAGADSAETKSASSTYKPVVVRRQHESTFYGLAKSAGDTTQSASSNAVGVYTDEAKAAIAEMLGLPYERLIYRDDTFGNVWSERQVVAFDVENSTVTLNDVTGIPTDEVSAKRSAYIVYKPILNLQYGNLPTELLTFGRIKCIGDNKIQFYKDDGTTLVTFTDTGCLDASKCRMLIYTGASQTNPKVDNLLSNHKYHVRFTYYGWLPDSSGVSTTTEHGGTGYSQSDAKRRDVMLFVNKNNSVTVPGQYDSYFGTVGNRVLQNANYLSAQMNATFGQFDIWIEPYGVLNGCKYTTELVTMCANTTNKTEWMYPKFAISRGLMNEPVSTIQMGTNNALDRFANGCIFEVWDCGTHF